VALPAFAAAHLAAAERRPPVVQQSINIHYSPGAQQQTDRLPLLDQSINQSIKTLIQVDKPQRP